MFLRPERTSVYMVARKLLSKCHSGQAEIPPEVLSGSKRGAVQKGLPLWVWRTRTSTIADKQSLGRPAATRKQNRLAWCTIRDLAAALTWETDVVFEYFDM
jgi:hypothetical protein